MNIYLVDGKEKCDAIAQLIRLNAECVKLHWSKTIKDLPTDVLKSLEVIEDYVGEGIRNLSDSNFGEMTEEEERELNARIKSDSYLKSVLGSCVIQQGEEASKVMNSLSDNIWANKIVQALSSGKAVILF